MIDRQLKQMTRLIDDLMDLSRITRNKVELQCRQVKLADVVHAALETSQPLIEAGGHRFTLQMPGEPILIEADAARLSQVMSNLLNNAAKFTPRGGHITLRVERDGDHAVMRVRDTGVGMSHAEIEQALKPFKQINALKRGRSDGTGLGLPLTKAMVEANRARFSINSTPGEGTLVEITFPSTRVLAD